MSTNRDRLAEIVRSRLPEGAEFDAAFSTGGGCMAMGAFIPTGEVDDAGFKTYREVMLTDGDSQLPFTVEGWDDVCFSYYTDGEFEGYCTVSAGVGDFWSNVETTVDAWVAGDPWFDFAEGV